MIVNLTQHQSTPEQGVTDLSGAALEELKRLLTFDFLPSVEDIEARAQEIAILAYGLGAETAMIGGAPYLMGPLERRLAAWGIKSLFSFSARVSEEKTLPDGSVQKVAVFRHLGFVPGAEKVAPGGGIRRCQCGSGDFWAECTEGSPYCG